MVRLAPIALILISLPAAAWGSPPAAADDHKQQRSFHLPNPPDLRQFGRDGPAVKAEIAPNTHFGLGIFGLNFDKSGLQPVTGREIDTRKQRRAAVGFSLKF